MEGAPVRVCVCGCRMVSFSRRGSHELALLLPFKARLPRLRLSLNHSVAQPPYSTLGRKGLFVCARARIHARIPAGQCSAIRLANHTSRVFASTSDAEAMTILVPQACRQTSQLSRSSVATHTPERPPNKPRNIRTPPRSGDRQLVSGTPSSRSVLHHLQPYQRQPHRHLILPRWIAPCRAWQSSARLARI